MINVTKPTREAAKQKEHTQPLDKTDSDEPSLQLGSRINKPKKKSFPQIQKQKKLPIHSPNEEGSESKEFEVGTHFCTVQR